MFGLNDEAAARLIHGDGVHVLIDLSGHTAFNRLPVFAWKPAPVQLTWLGLPATTGVAEMDYVLGDPWAIPEQCAGAVQRSGVASATKLCVPDRAQPVGGSRAAAGIINGRDNLRQLQQPDQDERCGSGGVGAHP